MKEVAKALGISRTTVSLCLSGKAAKYKISEKTQKLVQDYVRKMGFVPNVMAQSITGGESNRVAIFSNIFDSSSNHEEAVNYAAKVLGTEKIDYYVQHYGPEELFTQIYKLRGQKFSNFLVVGFFHQPTEFINLLKPYLRDMRVFIIDYILHEGEEAIPNLYRIGIDRHNIYHEIFNYLWNSGHHTFAIDTPKEKAVFYREFMAKKGVEVNEDLIIQTQNDKHFFDIGVDICDQVVKLKEKYGITAVSLHDDQVAAGLIRALIDKGMKVPEDLSVMGFDNISAAPYFTVPLTTYEVPFKKMLDRAFEVIIQNKKIPNNLIVDGEIVVRESVKAN